MEADIKAATREEVTVTVTWPTGSEKAIKQISTDSGNTWKTYTGSVNKVVIRDNTTVIARIRVTSGEIKSTNLTINYINRIPPTISLNPNGGMGYTMPTTGNATIRATITATDIGKVGFKTLQYAWSTSNQEKPTNWLDFTNGREVSKTDCTEGVYYLWTNVIDNAGNEARNMQVSNSFIVNSNTEKPNKIILEPNKTEWTNEDVIVTATYGGNLTENKTLTSTGIENTDYTANGTTSIAVKTNNQTVTATATDIAGNKIIANLEIKNIDKIVPTLEITAEPSANLTNASSITYTFTFSEDVTGFTADDITVENGTKGEFAGSGKTYTLVVTNSGTCTQTVTVDANKCVDVANNGNTKATKTVTIDRTAPKVNLSPNGGSGYTMPTTGNATIKTVATVEETGGSGLTTVQYAWSTSNSTEPTSGWTDFTSGATISKTDISTAGTWYLWTKVIDGVGNRATTVKTSEGFVVGANTDASNTITLTPSKDITQWTNEDITVTATYGANLTANKTLTCTGTANTDYTANGTTSVTVKTNNQTITATATDKAGNQITKTITINKIDKTEPTASSIEIKNITATGYDVYVYDVTDNDGSGVNRVQFPTWTESNEKDDIQSNWETNASATGVKQSDGTTWVYRVNTTDHNKEIGVYNTQVYVYDNVGNSQQIASKQATVPAVNITYDTNYYSSNIWTDTEKTAKYSSAGTAPTSKENVADTTVMNGKIVKFVMPAGTSGGPYYSPSAALTSGKQYTWSVYVKASTNKTLNIGQEQGGQKTVNVTTSWQKITHTFTANSNTCKAFVFYLTGGSTWTAGDELYVHSLEIMAGTPSNTTASKAYATELGTLSTPTRTGYTFAGWFTSATGGTQISSTTTVPAQNTTYYAHWTINSYYIDLNMNVDGTSYGSGYNDRVTVGFKVDGVDKGYIKDYYTQHVYGTAWEIYGLKIDNVSVAYTASGTLGAGNVSALVSLNTLTFAVNNSSYGSVSTSELLIVKGKTFSTSGATLTLEDGRKVTASTKAVTGYTTAFTSWSSTSGTISAATTITANFSATINSYTLTVNPNGGTWNSTTSNSTVTQNYATTKALGNPTAPAGYTVTFNGNGGTSASATLTSTKSFSKWTVSGSGSISGTTYTFGAGNGTVTASYTNNSITLPTATRTGYTFTGWYDASSGGNKIGAAGASYTPTAAKTLYAQWTINSYTLTVNPNGGKWNNTTSDSTVTQNYATTKDLGNPTVPAGYAVTFNGNGGTTSTITSTKEFTGWTLSGAGSISGTTYTFGAGAGTVTAGYKNKAITFPSSTRDGYTFLGWYDAASGGNKIGDAGASYTPTAAKTFYAQWKAAGPANITTATSIQSKTTTYQDSKGNKVVVPGGFKVRTDLATTVDKGIVIEDSSGNQFVWVPIGTITKADGSKVTIDLGRYTFDTSTGTPTLKQAASNYASQVAVPDYNNADTFELATSRTSDGSSTNTTAKNLAEFVTKTQANGGYYMGRFEASNSSTGLSKSGVAPVGSITQPNAATAARAMYNGNSYVVSDLVNSYMWDTAIVFIQKCSSSTNYANKKDGSGSKKNTGASSDVVCNIYDMGGNLYEWTTEYSTYTGCYAGPCVGRGGCYYSGGTYCTARRLSSTPTGSSEYNGFRVALYIL